MSETATEYGTTSFAGSLLLMRSPDINDFYRYPRETMRYAKKIEVYVTFIYLFIYEISICI